jgi:hypothetical protein
VVGGEAPGHASELAMATDIDLLAGQCGDQRLEGRATGLGVDRLPVPGELVPLHLVHPGAGAEPFRIEANVATLVEHCGDLGLVRRLVRAEPDVTVRPEDLAASELGLELREQRGHRCVHLLLIRLLVRGPVRLRVVDRELLEELQGIGWPSAKRHARSLRHVRYRQVGLRADQQVRLISPD